MAYTVDAAFDEFYDRINLSGDHREIANARKEHLMELLAGKFEVLDSFGTGSIPRFTALKGHSDVDIMLVLHYGNHIKGKSPAQVLEQVREALAYKTNVRKNGQAVTLYYDTWPNVDIVPVSRSKDGQGNVTHYNVPNANTGSWLRSRPRTHSRNIDSKAEECGENFRRIIKMIKWWNLAHGDYLQSYHIEVLGLKTMSGNADDTPWKVLQFFDQSRELLESQITHDGGVVDEYLGPQERQEVLKRFDTAILRARPAWHATYGSNKNHQTAVSQWKAVFGEKFPSYG